MPACVLFQSFSDSLFGLGTSDFGWALLGFFGGLLLAAQLGAHVGPSASQEVFDMVDREADGSDSLAARRFEPCHFAPGQTIVAQAPRGSNLVCGRSLDSLDMTTRGSV